MSDFIKLLDDQEERAHQRYTRLSQTWAKVSKLLRTATRSPARRLRSVEDKHRFRQRFSLVPDRDGLARERILGTTDLLAVNYLSLGRKASRSVCRIQIRNRSGRPQGFGTGFLVSPTLLLTNNHVIDSREMSLRSLAEFDFEEDETFHPKGSVLFNLDQSRFFYTDVQLDFTLVAVKARSINHRPLSEFGFLSLIEDSGKALVGESVSIIQHPDGGDKKIALRDNRVIGVVDAFLQYETDTMPGSSGAPVFNDQWDIVAVHHAGIPAKNRNGKPLAKDGRVWKAEMGRDRKRWVANEGIRISAIFSHLRRQDHWDANARGLLQGLGVQLQETAAGALPPAENTTVAETATAPSPAIGIRDFYALLGSEGATEKHLRPYVRLDLEASGAFAPAFRLNRETLAGLRNDSDEPLLTWVDAWSRSLRQRNYRQQLASRSPVTKVVALGDSWFHYPFLLHDIVDHLVDREGLAIYSLGTGGEPIRDVIAKGEYLDAIAKEAPDCLLISSGGSDLFATGRLSRLLHPFDAEREPGRYPNDVFDALLQHIDSTFDGLFRFLTQRFPRLPILYHGYDYLVPHHGPWLGNPLARMGIEEPMLQRRIIALLIDRLNTTLEAVATRHHSVSLLDLRHSVPPGAWADELHPSSAAFGDIAALFADAIRSACSSASIPATGQTG